jgi:monovalent cation:H+ antiporter-2, CPA2 family
LSPLYRIVDCRGISGEGEVARAMTETILSDLGATPEQIDCERARVHEELL